ncbi:methionine--tRNA ligase [Candidatus Woesearchaeota archaeon]|nr:methionine--tRNA ligase [Candidatus Woesearchaeota archaeon]
MPKTKFYITTAIDYVNSAPHVGHSYEKIIADALARWHRLKGEDVFFLTGTDDNASKNEEAAKVAGMPTRKFVDKNAKVFQLLCKKLNLSNDRFIRTVEQSHVNVAQTIFKKVYEKGDIYKGIYSGLYCKGCEAFYTEKDLIEGKCPEHKKEPEKLEEESYFFKLSKYKDQILKLIENHNLIFPKEKSNEIISRLKSEELKDLSVSRVNKSWGIKTPVDPKHTIYVWFDALLNYISGIDYPKAKFKKYWPADVHFIGKGINWFHSVIWPGILFSAGIEPPKTILVHGYLTVNGQKIGKSLGNVIDPLHLIDKYGVDALRYFFLREIPAGQDGDFSEEALVERCNADLADTVGNLLQRTVVLIHKNFDGKIPKVDCLHDIDAEIIKKVHVAHEVDQLMLNYEWNKALEKILEFVHDCNKYINEAQPWKVNDKKRLGTILYVIIECLRIVSILLFPFIPETAQKIAKQLGQKIGDWKNIEFKKATKGKLLKPEIVFPKLSKPLVDNFSDFNLIVGIVKKVEPHPNADKLYKLSVDIGEEINLVAGLKQHYTPDNLVGKHVIVVKNMKPANIRGVESQGMLLAGDKDGIVKVLEASHAKPGDQVTVENISLNPKPQVTIEEVLSLKLIVQGGRAKYKEKDLLVAGKPVISEAFDGAKVR